MEKKWKHSRSGVVRGVLVAACAFFFFMNGQFTSQAAGTGKIKVGSAIIRQSADTNSEPVATSSQGTVVTINNEVTDAAGSVWYEIQVDANTIGYVRSDLVEKEGGSDTSAGAAQQADNAGFAPGAEIEPEAPLDAQYATIKVKSTAKIRTAASTNKGIVDSLPNGSQVIISGQTNGSDKLWYYITFTGTDGTEKSGYVRSDLVTLGEMVPVQEPEEQPVEEPSEPVEEPEPEVKEDYELAYQPNQEGEYEWYFIDRTGEKTQQLKVQEMLDVIYALDVNQSIDAKTVSRQRIIIVALIGVIVLLAVIMTILVFKLRDASYEDDDEEDDDEEEDDRRRGREEPSRRRQEERDETARRRTADGRAAGTRRSDARRSGDTGRISEGRRSQSPGRNADARRSSDARRTSDGRRSAPEREVRYEEDMDVPVKTGTKRKAKNFMVDDDEFEFEFLNMKDKDM